MSTPAASVSSYLHLPPSHSSRHDSDSYERPSSSACWHFSSNSPPPPPPPTPSAGQYIQAVAVNNARPKATPFKVASSIMLIATNLVKHIQALEFVDMLELFPNYIPLAATLAAPPPSLVPPKTEGNQVGRRHWDLLFCHLCGLSAPTPGLHGEPAAECSKYVQTLP